jgi:predicted ribosome quality control (RQC) complex YloA/Tae2 family protein
MDYINHPSFLKQIVEEYKDSLLGKYLFECYSNNKNDFYLKFRSKEEIFILAIYFGQTSFIYFPNNGEKSRLALNHFEQVLNLQVIDFQYLSNDRCLLILFKDEFTLLIKLYGKNGNIILFNKNQFVDLYREELKNDYEIDFQQLTSSKLEFNTESLYFILKDGDILKNQLPAILPSNSQDNADLVELLSNYVRQFQSFNKIIQLRNAAIKDLKHQIAHFDKKIKSNELKLSILRNDDHQKELGDIIMANLYELKAGMNTVFDFYNNKEISIKIPDNIAPIQFAEKIYRKHKNKNLEIESVEKNLQKSLYQLTQLNIQLKEIESSTNYKLISKKVKQKETSKPIVPPFYTFEMDGYEILCGKSAQSNDLLTFKIAKREDYWLHAQGVSGSHVIIKNPNKKTIDKSIIEYAAQISAFNSSAKNSDLVPVQYTRRKYVSKPRGAAPGAVNVLQYDTVIVSPTLKIQGY